MKHELPEEVVQKAEQLEEGLPEEFARVLNSFDPDNGTLGDFLKVLENVRAIENEQAHRDLADLFEITFVEVVLPEMTNILELQQISRVDELFGGVLGDLLEVFADCASDIKENAETLKSMQMICHMVKYVHDIKGDETDPVIKDYIEKLSALSDEEYNSSAKMLMLFVKVGLEKQELQRRSNKNPFRPSSDPSEPQP